MNFAICPLSVVSVRRNSFGKSEQLTQLLFGEMVEILEKKGKQWVKIRCTWDNCIGWVEARQIKPITPREYEFFRHNFAYSLDLLQPLLAGDHHLPITIGAQLPGFDGMRFRLDNLTYLFSGQAVFPKNLKPTIDLTLKIAKRYLYAPAQWGGRSPLGIDSSGFTQLVYKLLGIHLHRQPNQQVVQGHAVDFLSQSQPGDLAFFENRKGNIFHVGIILPEFELIHVSGRVRIDKIDHFGIFDSQTQRYTHKLRVVKRVLPKDKTYFSEKLEVEEVEKKQMELF